MSASQNNVSLVLNQQDVNGTNILNRLIGAISYAGIVGMFSDGLLTVTTAVVQTLPTATVLNYLLHNTHATATITITATPQGGSSAVVAVVPQGGVFLNWCPVTNTSAGYTAISLTASVANATFEQFIGG